MNDIGGKILMSFQTRITGIRVINSTLIPTDWKVNVEFFSVVDENDSAVESNVAYNVLYFWAHELMDDLIVFDVEDEFGKEIARISNNPILTTPGPPTDDIIVQVLHCKMCSIAGEYLGILKLSIRSDDSDLEYQYVDFKQGDALPGIEYIGDVNTNHTEPWWKRNTSECYDFPADEETYNIVEIKSKEGTQDILSRYRAVLRHKNSIGVNDDINPVSFDMDFDGTVEIDFSADFHVESDDEEDEDNIIEMPKDQK